MPTGPEQALAAVDGQVITIADQAEAIRSAITAAKAGEGFTFFTLNLDHLVKLRADALFRSAYRRARFVSADGAPVVALARRSGAAVVRRTAGSDLVAPLCGAAAAAQVPVFLFGSTPETLARSAAQLRRQFPALVIQGMEAPPFGFEPRSLEAAAAADRIARSGAPLVLVALGAPKQELFADLALQRHPGLGLVCIGAALDFIAGSQVRAPGVFQAVGLEWFWRLAHDPRRLAARYLACAALLLRLAVLEPLRRLVQPPRQIPGE